DGVDYQVRTHRPASATQPRVWQTDLAIGGVELAREYPAADDLPPAGTGWRVRLPRVSFSRTTARVVGFEGRLPRAAHIQDQSAALTLDRIGQAKLPGHEPVRAYFSRDGRKRLLVFRNELLFLDGEVTF